MDLFNTSNKTTSNTTQNATSSTILPQNVQESANNTLGFGNQVAQDYQTPLQQTPAGFVGDQSNYFDLVRNIANAGMAPGMQTAMNMAQAAGNYQPRDVYAPGYAAQNLDPNAMKGYQAAMLGGPMQVGNQQVSAQNVTMDPITAALAQANLLGNAQGYGIERATGAQIDPNSISRIQGPTTDALNSMTQSLMNPYTSSVYDTSLAQLDKARQMTQNVNAAQAAQAGAFGSTRQGVMDAETNNDFARQAAQLSAQLNSQGFTQAQNTAQALQQQQQAASGQNQNVDLQTALANAGYLQQAGLTNAGAQTAANQYLAGAQNQFSQLNQAAQNQMALANQSALNQIAMANQANNQWAQGSNQQANLQASLANAQNALQASLANQQAGLQTGLANQSAANNAGQYNSGLQFQGGLANQGAQNQSGMFNAGQNLAAFQSNQNAGLQAAGLGLQGAATYGNLANAGFGQALTGAQALGAAGNQQQGYNQSVQDTNYSNAQAQANNDYMRLMIAMQTLQGIPYGTTQTSSAQSASSGQVKNNPSLLSDIGNVAGFFSDIRLKEDIRPIGPHLRDPLKAVRRIRPATFHMKGTLPGQRDLGLIAQNVEQAAPEAVRSVGPMGIKAIHVPAMLGLLTGAIHQLDQKVSGKKTANAFA